VAANRTWTTESGERKQDASFIECTAWHRTAEVIAQYFRKGHPILVEGELRNSNWATESGEKRTRIYLHVDHFTFLRSKREGESAQAAPAPAIGRHGPDGQDDVPF
jgi:single-strand DNA-binding protein